MCLDSKAPGSNPLPQGLQPTIGESLTARLPPEAHSAKKTAGYCPWGKGPLVCHHLPSKKQVSQSLRLQRDGWVSTSKEGLKEKDRLSSICEKENKVKTQQKRTATLAILATYHERTNKGLMVGKKLKMCDPDCQSPCSGYAPLLP